MSSPQYEEGYTKIANELLEALCHIRISGEARQVLDAILRKTYGWNKKEDPISLSQFSSLTGLKKIMICRSINKLVSMNLISKKDNGIAKIYKFNKDFSTWKPLAKKITLAKKIMGISNIANPPLAKKATTKETSTKETITKEKERSPSGNAKYDPSKIKSIMDIFYKINPTLPFGHKSQREAITDMFDLWGIEKTIKMAEYAISLHGEPFAPVITTPYQLKLRSSQLAGFWQKQNKTKSNLTIAI